MVWPCQPSILCLCICICMMPFRQLLKPNTPFIWNNQLEEIFQKSKQTIVNEIEESVRIFNETRPTCLVTDWSKTGIGFWLLQKHCICTQIRPFCCNTGWRTTLVGSRFTHPNEADVLHRARFFVLGYEELLIAVDHKPLLKIFGDHSLNDIENPRLRNLKEKTLQYRLKMVHLPGARNKAVDAVSRHPTDTDQTEILDLPDDSAASTTSLNIPPTASDGLFTSKADNELHLAAISSIISLKTITWDKVKTTTISDPIMLHLLETIESGFQSIQANCSVSVRASLAKNHEKR